MVGFRYEPAIARVTFSGYIRLPRRLTERVTNNPAPSCMTKYEGPIVSPFIASACECGYPIASHEIHSGTFTVPDKDAGVALDRYIAALKIEDVEIVRLYPVAL